LLALVSGGMKCGGAGERPWLLEERCDQGADLWTRCAADVEILFGEVLAALLASMQSECGGNIA